MIRKIIYFNRIKKLLYLVLLPPIVMVFMAVGAAFVYKTYTDVMVKGYLEDMNIENSIIQRNAIYQIGRKKDEANIIIRFVRIFFTEAKTKSLIVEKTGPYLNSLDEELRLNTIKTLGMIGGKTAVPLLIDLLSKEKMLDSEAVQAAVESLGKLGDQTAIPVLLKFTNHKDLTARLAAIWAVGNIGDKSAIHHLTFFLKDSDKYVRHQAAMALRKIK